MALDTFALTLTEPARIRLEHYSATAEYDKPLADRCALRRGYPDWLGFPDLLVDSKSKSFSGIVLPLTNDLGEARRACSNLDANIVRIVDKHSAIAGESYICQDELWLEVVWARMAQPEYVPAQLAEIHFYLRTDLESGASQSLVAVELFRLSYVLRDFEMVMPDLSAFPRI